MVSSPLSYLFTLHQSVVQNLSDMKHFTFEIGAAQLCNVSEIAPKSPFLLGAKGAKVYCDSKLSLLIE